MKATLKWTDGYQMVARTDDSPAVVIDSSDGGSGPTPMQLLLMGVAGCTGIDVIAILKKRRANLTGLKINIFGAQKEEHPRRFEQIEIEYLLFGHDLKAKDVERAIKLSEEKYCSASASINAEISHSYQIFDADEVD